MTNNLTTLYKEGEFMGPIIGITGNQGQITSDVDTNMKINYSPAGYARAVRRAGGTPVIIPLGQPDTAKNYIDFIDGLLLTGGQDISPLMYGEEPHLSIGLTHPKRDRVESALIREALASQTPILGVCRGMQLVNVVLGGTLIQDLNEEAGVSIQHVQRSLSQYPTHTISVKSDSYLANILPNNMHINSAHHQAVKSLGKGLKVAAWSSDNVIEAFESDDAHHHIIGVQWHPEDLIESSPECLAVFEDLVNRAAQRRNRLTCQSFYN